MSCITVTKGQVLRGATGVFLARIEDSAGAIAKQISFSSITYKVFNVTAGNVEVATGTVTIATAVFDTLKTGSPWSVDDEGYSFKHSLTAFNVGSSDYRVEYKLTFADASIGWLLYDVLAVGVLTP